MSGAEGQFRWELMGKADFSRCAGMIASLPADLRSEMNSSAHGVCVRLLHLCWYHAEHSGRGHAFAIPSQGWLAKCIDRCDRTVRRAIDWLVGQGLITSQRRRPRQGVNQTNVYGLGKRLLAVIYAAAGQKVKQYHDRTKVSDNDLKKGIEGATPQAPPSHSPFSNAKQRAQLPIASPAGLAIGAGAQSQEETDMATRGTIERTGETMTQMLARKARERGEAPVVKAAKTEWDHETTPEETRRETLKKQAQWLKERGL